MYILGFDIGGTKCAVVTAISDGENIRILKKESLPTDHNISVRGFIQFKLFSHSIDCYPTVNAVCKWLNKHFFNVGS